MENTQCHGSYAKTSIPDLSGVDYDQPLEMIRSAQVKSLRLSVTT